VIFKIEKKKEEKNRSLSFEERNEVAKKRMEKIEQSSKGIIADLENPPPYLLNLKCAIVRHEILFDQSSSISEKNSNLILHCANYYVGLLEDNEHFTHEYQRIGFANALVYYKKDEDVKTVKFKGNKTFLYDAISNVVLSLDKKEGELKYLTIITDDRDESPMKKKNSGIYRQHTS